MLVTIVGITRVLVSFLFITHKIHQFWICSIKVYRVITTTVYFIQSLNSLKSINLVLRLSHTQLIELSHHLLLKGGLLCNQCCDTIYRSYLRAFSFHFWIHHLAILDYLVQFNSRECTTHYNFYPKPDHLSLNLKKLLYYGQSLQQKYLLLPYWYIGNADNL